MKKFIAFALSMMVLIANLQPVYAEDIDLDDMVISSLQSYTYYVKGVRKNLTLGEVDDKGNLSNQVMPIIKSAVASVDSLTKDRSLVGAPIVTISVKDREYHVGTKESVLGYRVSIHENGMVLSKYNYIKRNVTTDYMDDKGEIQTRVISAYDRDGDALLEGSIIYSGINFSNQIKAAINQHIKNTIGEDVQDLNLQSISHFKKLYEGTMQGNTQGNGMYTWGLCSFSIGDKTHYKAFLSLLRDEYYLGDFYEQNKVRFNSSQWISANQYYNGPASEEDFYAELDFKADNDYIIYEITLDIKHANADKVRNLSVQMSHYKEQGSIKDFNGFDFKLDDFKAEIFSFLEDQEVNSVGYVYNYNGKSESFAKDRGQLNAEGMDGKIKAILKSGDYERISPKEESARHDISIGFRNSETKKLTNVTLYSDYMTIRLNKSVQGEIYFAYYSYGKSNVLGELKELFDHWKEEAEKTIGQPKVNYVDLSSYKPHYVAEFEIEIDNLQKNTWIGELAENGKVQCKITYFTTSGFTSDTQKSMVTLKGNNKEFNLMQSPNYMGTDTFKRYETEYIGIYQDTPLPHTLEKEGVIELNFTTPTEYNSKRPLTAKIYEQVYIEEKGLIVYDIDGKVVQGAKSPVGNTITINKKGEMIDLLEKKDTPVVTATPKGQIFTDVNTDHWAHRDIENFYYANIVRGIGGGLFAPSDHITEEHFGFLLQRLFGYDDTRAAQTPAARQNVISSLVKALKLENAKIVNDNILGETFEDANLISEENLNDIKIAVENGLVVGFNGFLNPNANLTRAEAVTLLRRGIAKVYNIGEDVRPEFYKFEIKPVENEYIEISSEEPLEIWLKKDGRQDVLVREKDRLSGKILFTFGDDVVADTKILAVCIADEDVYTIEAISFDALRFGEVILFEANINTYKNGEIYKVNEATRITVDKEEDLISIGAGTNKLVFENIKFSDGKMPSPPAKQPFEEYEDEWGGGKYIIASEMGLFKGDGFEVGFNDYIIGYVQIQYNNKGNNIKVVSQIFIDDKPGMQNIYQIEAAQVVSITNSEVSGLFNIKCNGEIVAEGISAKFIGTDADLGKKMKFVSDDGVWDLEMYITEKSG